MTWKCTINACVKFGNLQYLVGMPADTMGWYVVSIVFQCGKSSMKAYITGVLMVLQHACAVHVSYVSEAFFIPLPRSSLSPIIPCWVTVLCWSSVPWPSCQPTASDCMVSCLYCTLSLVLSHVCHTYFSLCHHPHFIIMYCIAAPKFSTVWFISAHCFNNKSEDSMTNRGRSSHDH